MCPVRSFRNKMNFSPHIFTRISFFQSFGVQIVHYIIHKTSWYIELIQLSAFLVHGSVSELLPRVSKFNFHCPSYITHSTVLFIVKKLILSQCSIKRANAPGEDTVSQLTKSKIYEQLRPSRTYLVKSALRSSSSNQFLLPIRAITARGALPYWVILGMCGQNGWVFQAENLDDPAATHPCTNGVEVPPPPPGHHGQIICKSL